MQPSIPLTGKQTPELIHKTPLIPSGPRRILCVGSSGSGKTYGLLSLIPSLASLKAVAIFAKVQDQLAPVYESIQKYCKANKIDYSISSEIDPEIIRALAGKKGHKLVIVDDFSTGEQELLVPLYSRGRHHQISVIDLCQNPYMAHKDIRNNSNTYIIYSLGATNQLNALASALSPVMDNDTFKRAYRAATAKKYTPLVVFMDAPAPLQIRQGFDRFLAERLKKR